MTLDEFVATHDILQNGPPLPLDLPASAFSHHPQTDFSRVMKLANVSICNNLPSIPALHAYLDQVNLLDEERLRPGWDTYFMVSFSDLLYISLHYSSSNAEYQDSGFVGFTSFKLYETPSRRLARSVQTNPLDGI